MIASWNASPQAWEAENQETSSSSNPVLSLSVVGPVRAALGGHEISIRSRRSSRRAGLLALNAGHQETRERLVCIASNNRVLGTVGAPLSRLANPPPCSVTTISPRFISISRLLWTAGDFPGAPPSRAAPATAEARAGSTLHGELTHPPDDHPGAATAPMPAGFGETERCCRSR